MQADLMSAAFNLDLECYFNEAALMREAAERITLLEVETTIMADVVAFLNQLEELPTEVYTRAQVLQPLYQIFVVTQ